MLQFKIQGRGGQGAQKAGEILAEAFFREGKYVQTYSTYGGARRGTPVSTFFREDDKPINLRCDIENPDVIMCFDSSLLNDALLKGANEDTLLLINSTNSPDYFAGLGNFKIATIDAINLARANKIGRFVNSVLVGAFAALMEKPNINVLIQVVKDISPAKVEQNVNACLDGYNFFAKGGVK